MSINLTICSTLKYFDWQDCYNCQDDCPPGSPSCLSCECCLGLQDGGPDCRTCLENSVDIPGCRQCQTCPGILSNSEAQSFENNVEGSARGAFEDNEDLWRGFPSCLPSCSTCFKISFAHLGCLQCRSCPGGPADTAKYIQKDKMAVRGTMVRSEVCNSGCFSIS